MLKPSIFFLISFLFLFSCNKSEGDSVLLSPNEEIDSTKPSIKIISDFEGVIEDDTQITFLISDNSENVKTTVRINDFVIIDTIAKEFSIQIDPFEFLNGEHVLSIESLDESNNEGVLTEIIQIQKLLFVFPDIQILSFLQSESLEYYLLINKINGDLVESRIIESSLENRFYATDDFERQNFTVTLFGMPKNESILNGFAVTYSDLSPGSVSLSSMQLEERSIPNIEKDKEFNLSLTDVQNISNIKMFGRDYQNGPFYPESDIYNSSISYSSNKEGPIFIYYSENKNNLNDYKFHFLNEYSDTEISLNDFSSASTTIELNSPSGIDNFGFTLRGYISDEAYEDDIFNEIYRNNFESYELGIFEVPQFNVYKVYSQHFSADLDENTKFLSTKKGLGPVTIPNWTASLSGNTVLTNGNYDIFQIIANYRLPTSSGTFVFDWYYHKPNSPEFDMPFANFEIPDEIKEKLDNVALNVNDVENAENLSFSMQDFEISIRMEEGAFTGFRRLNRNKDYNSVFITLR